MFTWQDFFKFEVRKIQNNLCVFAKHELGMFMYLPPLGKRIHPKTIDACFACMEQQNQGQGITRVENVPEQMLKGFPEDTFKRYLKGYEYCYFKEDLISLRGNAYKSQRSSINYFEKNYSYQFCPYTDTMFAQCLALYHDWAKKRKGASTDVIYRQMIDDSLAMHTLALKYWRKLGLVGRVVIVENKIRAYTFGYPLSKDIFCVLLEITDLETKGLANFIFHAFCQDQALKPYPFINVMDDFELPNIRQTKLSYKPAHMVPAYVVSRK
jgi:hypothetical protein